MPPPGRDPPLVLEYVTPRADGAPAEPSPALRWFGVAAAALPAATPFPAFTFGTSPLDVVRDLPAWPNDFVLVAIAAPFFLGCWLLPWKLATALRGRTGRPTRTLAWLFALAGAGLTLWVCAHAVYDNVSSGSWSGDDWTLVLPLGVLAPAAVYVVLLLRRRSREAAATTAVYGAYLANALLCLVAFRDGPGPGWWLTLAATVPMTAELVAWGLFTFRRDR